jgi:hypothetical protein
VQWNGERGRTYFLQNEMPYDAPDQASWMDAKSRGFPACLAEPAASPI